MPQIADPDHHTEIYEELIPPSALLGRFAEALRFVEAHAELSRRLTPHHRIHAIAMELEVKELMGDWPSIRERTAVVERLVAENLGTPCIRNARSLLVEAVAHAYGGGSEAATAARGARARDRARGLRLPALRPARPAGAPPRRARHSRAACSARTSPAAATTGCSPPRWSRPVSTGCWRSGGSTRSSVKQHRCCRSRRSCGRSRSARSALARQDDALLAAALEGFERFGLGFHAEETRLVLEA